MNTKIIAAFVLATVIAAPAFADGDPYYPHQPVAAAAQPGGLTRAQVRAQLVQIEKAGYNPARSNDPSYPAALQAAEARVAAQNGAASSNAGPTRAQVRADLVQIEKAGYNPAGDNTQYPKNLQAAEARVAVQDDVASRDGGVVSGSSTSGALASVRPAANDGMAPIYSGS